MPTILLVEDNELNREMLSRRLARRGYLIEEAVSGPEAIRQAKTTKPDLILMDLDLPEIDGTEAAGILRSEPATKNIPIVALTAHATMADRERALRAGCNAFQSKPVDFENLLSVIESLLA